jgi:hypothetical protein
MQAGDVYEEVISELKQHGAALVRTKKHDVWRFPDGRSLTISRSPSDRKNAGLNAMRDLRRLLGTVPVHQDGERRERRRRSTVRARIPLLEPKPTNALMTIADKLTMMQPRMRPSLVAPKMQCSPVYLERIERTPLMVIMANVCRLLKIS